MSFLEPFVRRSRLAPMAPLSDSQLHEDDVILEPPLILHFLVFVVFGGLSALIVLPQPAPSCLDDGCAKIAVTQLTVENPGGTISNAISLPFALWRSTSASV
jgi:hypothetical protein